MWTGVVSTASGVVFSGDDDGHMIALDGANGKHLWHYYTGDDLTASPITYEVDGKQYVSIASGTNVFAFALFEPVQQ
jgi:alcohol dehydrogenase (cytochrome c)